MTAYKYRFSTGDIVAARDKSVFICVKKIRLIDGAFSTKDYTGETWKVCDLINLISLEMQLSAPIQKAYEMKILNREE